MKRTLLFSITVITLSTFFFYQCTSVKSKADDDNDASHEIIEQEPINLEYGLPVDSFNVETGKIRRNQNLSHLLLKNGITPKTIDKISKLSNVFDVRKMRSGNLYKMFFTKDTLQKLSYFVYEHTTTDFVVIDFTDSVNIAVNEKPTAIVKKLASGIIKTNLWDAMVDNHINPMMSIELSEIYAWSIDFFDLKEDDQFYVIYEEKMLDDTVSVGIDRIHAALFNHQNKDFYAIYFVQDETPSFFNEEGGNLKREFLKAPLKFNRISSRFSKSRFHPVLKIYRPHSGVDYAAPAGTPVYSVGDGVVAKKGYQRRGAGNFIKIKHNSVYATQYAHLMRFAANLKKGDKVKQGQLIGYVGKTGYATGPHLDFRFFKNGEAVDPLKVDAPRIEPIKKLNREEFNKLRDEYVRQLDEQRFNFLRIADQNKLANQN